MAGKAALRAQDTGERVWVFDPQGIAHAPRTWWWNPLAAVNSVEEAERLASHFVLTVEGKDGDIWGPAGASLLSTLIMAAKVSGGTLLDVYTWLNDDSDPTPGTLLKQHGHPLLAKEFEGTRTMAHETRASVYFTARTATKCLRNPQITSWVTPPLPGEDVEEIDTAAFPLSRQTLYLLSKDGGGSAAPLVAALTDRMMREGVHAAELRGGRLDPPMMVLLDEAANICRIGDLPSLYSHLGSRGVIPLTILQSYAQGVGVWGDTGMKALWGAATVKVIGSGIDDASFAEDLSRLIGDHDVTVASVSYSDGRRTRSRSPQQRRVLPASEIRALPKGRVLVMTTGAKPAMLRAALVRGAARRADRRRREGGRGRAGRRGPPRRRSGPASTGRHGRPRRRGAAMSEEQGYDPGADFGPPPPADLTEAGRRIVALEAALEYVTELLAASAEGAVPAAAGAGGPVDDEEWEPYYGSLEEWVTDLFIVAFPRNVGQQNKWCPQWWDHAEAIMRLEVLWRSWEGARLDPVNGMAAWMAQQLDHHLPILLSPDGPFGQCTPDRHLAYKPLPVKPPPRGWFREPPEHAGDVA
ncbi:TraM recognition domain-containing protein [Motilibacter aurantiacus]|uniref:TraM recognition domain-containing protein n=1 Tax=Motilibacter aurantiacus TaxID=2714955 RepID=UPI0014074CD6|nr:DUF4913 domain-containing protein [Motilibacter aurantiacus]